MLCGMSVNAESLVRRYNLVRPHLNERQRRVWLGVEARDLGRSGVRVPPEVTFSRDPLSWLRLVPGDQVPGEVEVVDDLGGRSGDRGRAG